MHQTLSYPGVRLKSSKKITFILVESDIYDYADDFDLAARELGLNYDLLRIPHFKVQDLTLGRVAGLKKLISKKKREGIVVFCPSISELYLAEPDITLAFSAYRGWSD